MADEAAPGRARPPTLGSPRPEVAVEDQELDEAAALLVLITREDPEKLEAAAVRFLGRACLERSFITLDDAQLLVECLAQLERGDEESRVSFAGALGRLRLTRAAASLTRMSQGS